jgi:hypothetical protein
MAIDAVGRASGPERRALGRHLAGCAQCRNDAEEIRGAAAALGRLDANQVGRLAGGRPESTAPVVGPLPGSGPTGPTGLRRRRRVVVAAAAGVAALAVAAAAVGLVASTPPIPPSRTVALRGAAGVTASVSLAPQSWGTRATLRESGQPGGQDLQVSMRTASGRWWVAGSYRTTRSPGTVVVQLSCAAPAGQITQVWVSDQQGHTVLDGYAG